MKRERISVRSRRRLSPPRKDKGNGRRRRPEVHPFARVLDVVEEFAADLAAQGYRPRTVSTYRKTLRRLAPILPTVKSGLDLVRSLHALAPATRNGYLAAARSLDEWAVATGRAPRARLADRTRVRRTAEDPRPLSPEADRRLVSAALRDSDPRIPIYVLLMRDRGLRPSEPLSLRWRDVELDGGRAGVHVRAPDVEDADRFLPLDGARLLRRLRAAFKRARVRVPAADVADHYVLGLRWDRSRRWSYSAANRAWNRVCARAKVEAEAKQLRHTAATEWLRQGMDSEYVRRLLGHANLNMLKHYAKLTAVDLRRVLRKHEDENPRRDN